jgi:hypothetical protein
MHKFGYYVLPEGKALLLRIASSIRKNGYSTNPEGPAIVPTQEQLNSVFKLEPPFNIQSGLSHTLLAQQYYRDLGSRKGFSVHVYLNGIELELSPFPSHNTATKILGLSNKVIARYIDTNNTFKGYLFRSTPIPPKLY